MEESIGKIQTNKKKRNLKAVFLQPQWLVKDLQLQADDVTGAKKPFYHTNPYIIDKV